MMNQFKSGVVSDYNVLRYTCLIRTYLQFGLVELPSKSLLIGLTAQPRTFMGLIVSRDAWARAQQATNQSQANLALVSNLGASPNPGGVAQFRPALNQGQFQGQPYFGAAPNFAPAAPSKEYCTYLLTCLAHSSFQI